ATPVIMGVHADAEVLAMTNVLAHPLDLVRKYVGGCHFNRRRQVDNHGLTLVGSPHICDRINNVNGKIQLGTGETLWRILEGPVGIRVTGRNLFHDAGATHGDVTYTLTIQPKHLLSLHRRGGVRSEE